MTQNVSDFKDSDPFIMRRLKVLIHHLHQRESIYDIDNDLTDAILNAQAITEGVLCIGPCFFKRGEHRYLVMRNEEGLKAATMMVDKHFALLVGHADPDLAYGKESYAYTCLKHWIVSQAGIGSILGAEMMLHPSYDLDGETYRVLRLRQDTDAERTVRW